MQDFNSLETNIMRAILGAAVLAVAYAFFVRSRVLAQDKGSPRMQEVWGSMQAGAAAYLGQQVRPLRTLVIVLAAGAAASVLLIPPAPDVVERFGADQAQIWVAGGRAGGLVLGALLAYIAGSVGMKAAVEGNVRMAAAARKGYNPALRIAYGAGSVGSMLTVGMGLLGSAAIFMLFGITAMDELLSFGAGAMLVTLFQRVGGGIYAQAADLGTDMVEKVEFGLADNDPNNAAIIAGTVGENANDCAGVSADVFESLELTFVAALILGLALGPTADAERPFVMSFLLFPLMVRGVGVIAALLGSLFVRTDERRRNAMAALNQGFYATAILTVAGVAAVSYFFLADPDTAMIDWRPFLATSVGVLLALGLNRVTQYFTATTYDRVREVARLSRTGPATNILAGMTQGMESGLWAVLVIAAAILASVFIYAELAAVTVAYIFYGIALTGLGLLTLMGNMLALHSFGAIANNARRIGGIAGVDKNARNVMEDMDAVGNQTRALTRGTTTGATVIAVVALFGAFLVNTAQVQRFLEYPVLTGINLAAPLVLISFLIGGAVPLLFTSLTLHAVLRTAAQVVAATRQQLQRTATKPEDYARTIQLTTVATQQELVSMVLVGVLVPLLIGSLLGIEATGSFLLGSLLSSQLLAFFQANTGSAWSNARRYIEDGNVGGKHTEAHKAAIIGDTVGHPLKDSAGPVLNPLIRAISLLTLVIAPTLLLLRPLDTPISTPVWAVMALGGLLLLWAIWRSRRETPQMAELSKAAAAQGRI